MSRGRLSVTCIGLGAAPLGELFERVSDDQADAVVTAAVADGINFFDTAPWYGHGLSEHRTGRPLRAIDRADYVLSTKVGRVYARPSDAGSFRPPGPWVGGLRFALRFDYGASGILRSYEDSLQRLGLPEVDVLVVHDLDSGYHDPDTLAAHRSDLENSGWRALEALRDDGEISGIGVGINDHRMMSWFLERFDVDFFLVAMPYTLLDQAVLADEFPECQRRGIDVVIGAPFASGLLASGPVAGARYGYAPADRDTLARAARMSAIGAAHGVPLAAAALQFPLAHPVVAAVVPGAARAAMVHENVAGVAARIPDDFWSELRHEGLIDAAAPVPEEGWQQH